MKEQHTTSASISKRFASGQYDKAPEDEAAHDVVTALEPEVHWIEVGLR